MGYSELNVALVSPRYMRRVSTLCGLLVCAASGIAQTSGTLASGLSAAATASGANIVAEQGSPLDAMQGNVAGLARLDRPILDVGALGALAQGSFTNSVDAHGKLSGVAGVMPFAALGLPLGGSPWKMAVSFDPDMLMKATWTYIDPPGTAGVTYGRQTNESQIIALRSAVGVARSFGSHWSGGVSVGLVYNTNHLHSPYIFQVQPALSGLKVLLDLNTSGIGWNGNAGAQWQPTGRLRLGGSWKSGTSIVSRGTAQGDASALFAALGVTAPSIYSYAAEVDNHLPQAASVGLSLVAAKHMTVKAQGDWIGWDSAFRSLPVSLTGGTNAVINSVVGSNALQDEVALHWHNQGVLHTGVEMPVSEFIRVRGGYTFLSDPVPSATLTPLTAAILRHTLCAGAGITKGRWTWDSAYTLQLPVTQTVGQSALQAGEYSSSRVRVMTQALTISARLKF